MTQMSRRLVIGALAGAALPGVATGAPAPALDPVVIIEAWLLPRYDALVAATKAQADAWSAFAAKPEAGAVAGLKAAFAKAADAWTAVEFVTLGPVSQDLRPDRFNFFPDRRNAIARAMGEVIADADPARLEPARFAQSGAGAQGLPALERLLHEEGAVDALLQGPEAARRAAYGRAIAQNLAAMAAEVRTAWGDRKAGVLGAIVSGKGDPALFPDVGALPGMILTDLSGAYQRVTDTKILPVLGPGPDNAKPTLADGWRAGRSGRVVTVMIQSADALLQEVGKQLPSRPQFVVNKAATAADKAAEAFPADLSAAAQSADGAAKVEAAVKVFKAAQLTVYRPIASYFAISLGFNALDGD
ncbi:imelysin family protein [Azorhizobium doebereinerae]|uniref:imelysin family protein n=1 Tax=Azorhizobium doebereinerae TaxID=281091 RepID=UPI000416F180|nr:imelysin family protein [Azorhizobium doebereinerae]